MGMPAPISSGFNRIVLFLLMLLGIVIVAGVGLAFEHGKKALFDYIAYVAPVFAGVAGGLGIYYSAFSRTFFWVSGVLLCIGLICYLLDKGVAKEAFILIVPVFGLILAVGLLIDHFWAPQPFVLDAQTQKKRFYETILISSLIVIFSFYFFYFLYGMPGSLEK